jgi:hypothetical protein
VAELDAPELDSAGCGARVAAAAGPAPSTKVSEARANNAVTVGRRRSQAVMKAQ